MFSKRFRVGFLLVAAFLTCGLSTALAQALRPPAQDWVLRFTGGGSAAMAPICPEMNLGDAFTMEAWIYPESQGQWSFIMDKYDNESGGFYGIEYSDNALVFNQWSPGVGGQAYYSAPQNFELKKWMHVAASRNVGGLMRLYINGIEVAQGQSTGPCEPNSGPFVIGSRADGYIGSFWGTICQARIWNYPRSSEEIQSDAGLRLMGNESGLLAYWPLDDGLGHIARDLTPNGLNLTLPYSSYPYYRHHPRWIRTSVLYSGPYLASARRIEGYSGPLIDFDSDGDLDMVGWMGTGLIAHRNNGANTFEDATSDVIFQYHTLYPGHYETPYVIDVNHDGRQDLFVTQQGQPLIFIQSLDGKLIDETDARLPMIPPDTFMPFPGSVASGDVDEDGDLDLYIGNQDGAIPCFFMNDGNGYFVMKTDGLPEELGRNLVFSTSVLVDVDHDCDLDLVLGDRGGFIERNTIILLNDGAGHFSFAPADAMPPRTGGPTWWTINLKSADFNADGYPDLAMEVGEINAVNTNRVLLYMNNGNGTFRDDSNLIPFEYPAVEWSDPYPFPSVRAAVGDVNGDGRPDILIHGGGPSFFYLNTGNPEILFADNSDLFDNTSALPFFSFFDSGQFYAASFGDFEGDGDTDVMLVSPWDVAGFPFINTKQWTPNDPLPLPSEADLILPQNASDHQTLPILKWAGVVTAGSYQLQVATDQYFNNIAFDRNGITCSSHQPATLIKGETYYWRVRAINTRGAGAWSEVWSFYYGDIIPYTFEGFFSPIENSPVVNQAKAGQAVPVKWRITDRDGLPISDPASFIYITSYNVNCASFEGDPTNYVEEVAAGSSGLQYLGNGWWQFNWKTPKSYKGQCRVMKLILDDKSEHTASFSFK